MREMIPTRSVSLWYALYTHPMPAKDRLVKGVPERPVAALGRILARLVLLAFFLSVAIFDTNDSAWPAVSWPMFSQRTTPYTGQFYQRNVVRVLESNGRTHWIRPKDLWSMDRYHVGLRLINGSVSESDPRVAKHRRALIDCIRIKYPEFEPHRVEIWRLIWKLDLDAEHALDFDHPHESLLLASFGDELTGAVPAQKVIP